ncbi:MAG: exosortase B [Burkholderiales bacterium]
MAHAIEQSPSGTEGNQQLLSWIPIVAGFLALFVPVYVELAQGLWNTEEQGHGPLILMVTVWLFWRCRAQLAAVTRRQATISGGAVLLVGLLMYVLGRTQQIYAFEIGAQIPVVLGSVLIMRGWAGLRAATFPIFFLVFMIPWPGMIVDFATAPLKQGISEVAERVLYFAGFPIARTGVVLSIGPYQLLVADACSGLHSIISLSALGTLYLYLMQHRSLTRNLILAALLIPIAVSANVVRVIVLVLVTYTLGDEAGQGFLHGFAGMVLFVAALMFLFLVDSVLGTVPAFKDMGSQLASVR